MYDVIEELERIRDAYPTASLHYKVADLLLSGKTMQALVEILDAIEAAQQKD